MFSHWALSCCLPSAQTVSDNVWVQVELSNPWRQVGLELGKTSLPIPRCKRVNPLNYWETRAGNYERSPCFISICIASAWILIISRLLRWLMTAFYTLTMDDMSYCRSHYFFIWSLYQSSTGNETLTSWWEYVFFSTI